MFNKLEFIELKIAFNDTVRLSCSTERKIAFSGLNSSSIGDNVLDGTQSGVDTFTVAFDE
ncbi:MULTISPECIES: hypothetical protein [Yersinia pseudotuberculosis complex]|uniref:hypothetical protein n=1 Tax=Yersinia pseudotuberculosis complex TaxID=1649845 RepID=UPI000F84E66C|nr:MULTISPECIES: hypothetical protein [Yersinia pseudotuberculosis complex]MBO1548744.1 hypothetical protein [Yersinia pseudotuberculosis]MBO1554580.1 hypothetical protein [Yersinia pseudotuberculosis]MBO1568977.1 hypothetical protein [Yersinia pseudotuberculosis]MBO1583708.1 hypothetical protein [Yersinia pseudotuberculosis]MBO1633663.1 hypothetical protein [Yersinia pseudotuberculosis]